MSRTFNYSSSKTNLLVFCLLICSVFSLNLERHRVLVDQTPSPSGAPASYDWRSFTTMTPVKDQADCNAYYAFSTIAFFQQDLILYQNASTNIDLSQQFLATCLPNGGCVGGNPKDAMEYAIKKGGIPTQKDYPYSPWAIQAQDICYPSKEISVGSRPFVGFWNVNDQQFLKSLILKEPLNIYICSTDLKAYAPKSNSQRTLSCNPDNTNTDHTVLLIGYTETQWIIKNSWGTNWGLSGYGYISRNADNDCCIGSQVFLRGKQTKKQECAVQNCQVCVQDSYCSKCKPGYFITNKNGSQVCTQCNYANCAECENNVGYCKTCIFGYALYFPEQVCKVSTIPNCKSIVNGGCKTCHDGYKVNLNFTCETDCKIANCQLCKDDKSCSKCKPGFNLVYANGVLSCNQNKCKVENCATCDSKGKCLSCFGSYKVVEDSCVMICNKPNCQQCSTTQDICAKCNDGYALDFYSHECVVTNVANCNETYLTKYCSICQEGYIRSDSWQQCNKICAIDNCKTCQAGFANKCNFCNDGYTLKTPPNETIAICEKNPCNLANCSLCNTGGDTCVQCIDKYHVWDSNKKACVPYVCPLQNCDKCKTDSKKCQQCKSGTVPYIPTGGCTATTIDQCGAVGVSQNGTECWNCNNGFQIDYLTWKACERICKDSNCLDCSDSSTFCKKCPDGYGVKSVSDTENKCVKIPTYLPNCLLGNSDQTVCYKCKQFYFFNNKTSSCELNQNCPKDCNKCTGQNETLKCECKSGFVWDFLNNVCVLNPSDSQCLVISNYTGQPQCFECKDGFTLSQDGKGCTPDCSVENCFDCVSSDVENYPDYCQSCIDGYVVNLNLTKCIKCQVNYCKTCKGPEQLNICTQCKIGYELKQDGTCSEVPCQKNAVFNGLQCACSNTFYKDPTTEECKNCITSCKRCNSGDKCLQCLTGFYLNDGKCSACLENCQSCSDSSTCDACQQGYTYQIQNGKNFCAEIGLGRQGYFVLPSGKKARCSPGCASCAKSQMSCQQCLKGYILEGEKCVKCGDNCQTCYPNILNACKACEIGFLLVDGNCVRCKSDQCTQCPVQTDICTACLPGYYVKDQTCKSCGLGCNKCNADGTCDSCHTGYAMVEGGYCEQCLDGCAECSGEAMHECLGGCLQGTYRSGDNKCVNCPQVCKSCTGAKECKECIPGYDLVNGVCQKWCTDYNCYDCSQNSNFCKECYAGYEVSDGKCMQDLTCNNSTKETNTTTDGNSTNNNTTDTNNTTNNTTTNNTTDTDTNNTTNNNTTNNTTTNNTTNTTNNQTPINTSGDIVSTCQVCPKKYYLSSNFTCLQCTTTEPNCISCNMNAPQNCTQCAPNYYISQDAKCLKCADNCLTCRSQQFCYICNPGHYMVKQNKQYAGNCAKCDDNCLTCVDKPTNCLSCKSGFVLSVAGFCVNQDYIKYTIRIDMPFELFSKKVKPLRKDINSIIQNGFYDYYTQMINATKGSTIMKGYVSCQVDDNKKQCKNYAKMKDGLQYGKYLDNYSILQVSLEYNGEQFNSQPTNGDGGLQGWVIAVIVVGSIVAVIASIIIISLIVKKIKKNRAEKEETDQYKNSISLKETQQNLKKENPQLK